MRHPIPEYIPSEVGLGPKTKLTNQGRSSTPVPPQEGKGYRKNPVNDKDTDERRRDSYFVGQLIGVYQGRPFERANLDAGRLNRLWCDDILIVCDENHSETGEHARFRVDLERAEALMTRMRDKG